MSASNNTLHIDIKMQGKYKFLAAVFTALRKILPVRNLEIIRK
jgi:hypothetical protein